MTPLVAVKAKSMFTRKTFWVNLLVGLVALVSEVQAVLPDFADVLVIPPIWARRLLLAMAIANILLRRISDYPARFRPEERSVALERASPGEAARVRPSSG